MHILYRIKLTTSSLVSVLYVQSKENAYINHYEERQEIVWC